MPKKHLPLDLAPFDPDSPFFARLSMGCQIQHALCPRCSESGGTPVPEEVKERVKEISDFKLVSLSFVSMSDRAIKDVAEYAGVTEERLREYLNSNEQNGKLFRAYHYVTGCYPVGKYG